MTSGTTVAEAIERTRFTEGDELTVGVESEYGVCVTYSKGETDSRVSLGDLSA